MANHFKEYKNNVDRSKRTVLSDEEMALYGKTSGNIGISHSHPEWDVKKTPIDNSGQNEFRNDKSKTILRDLERENKSRLGEGKSGVGM